MKKGLLFLLIITSFLYSEEMKEEDIELLFLKAKPYLNPGIVAWRNGKWVGSDHLLNISNKIEIGVEIIKPPNLKLDTDEETIKAMIAKYFQKAGIKPKAEPEIGKPPLPVFHVVLLIYSVPKGYTIYCSGNLIEPVEISRIKLARETTFQAITWEKENMVYAPTDQLLSQIQKCIRDITDTFVERYLHFEVIKIRQK